MSTVPLESNTTLFSSEQGLDLELSYSSSASLTDNDNPYNPPHSMHWAEYVTWVTAFGVLVAVSVVGNSLVVWAVVWHQRMRTVTNYYLVNLALADLSMAYFNVIFNCIFMLRSDWMFGKHYCTFNNFVANLTVAASVFTLVAISADRYIAIMHPLQPRMSKQFAILTIFLVWASASVLSLPNLLYSSIASYRYGDGSLRTICFLHWPDGAGLDSTRDYMYNIVFLFVTYLIPMSVITITYIKMGRELWGSKGIGESSDRQLTNIKSKRRVVRMFIVVVTMFGVCWLPYHVYFLVQNQLFEAAYVQHLYLAIYWLAMSSTMYSPIIYFRMNSRFHEYFMTAAWCLGIRVNARPTNANGNNLSLHSGSTINTNTMGTPSPVHLGKLSNGEANSFPRCWNEKSLRTDARESKSFCNSYELQNGTRMTARNSESDSKNVSRSGSATTNGKIHSPKATIESKPLRLEVFCPSACNSDVVL